jgi:predicted DNA-binding transcriptional regulator
MQNIFVIGDDPIKGIIPDGGDSRYGCYFKGLSMYSLVGLPKCFRPTVFYPTPCFTKVVHIAFPGWKVSEGISDQMRDVMNDLMKNAEVVPGHSKILVAAGLSDLWLLPIVSSIRELVIDDLFIYDFSQLNLVFKLLVKGKNFCKIPFNFINFVYLYLSTCVTLVFYKLFKISDGLQTRAPHWQLKLSRELLQVDLTSTFDRLREILGQGDIVYLGCGTLPRKVAEHFDSEVDEQTLRERAKTLSKFREWAKGSFKSIDGSLSYIDIFGGLGVDSFFQINTLSSEGNANIAMRLSEIIASF